MQKDLTDLRPNTSLIPNTGIQFLDFGLKADAVQRISRRFYPEITETDDGEEATDGDGRLRIVLHVVETDPADPDLPPFYRPTKGSEGLTAPEDEIYEVTAKQALEAFDDEWLPLPLLRVMTTAGEFDVGPTNWARLRVVKTPEPDREGRTHRFVMAIDTTILERSEKRPYAAPTPRDVSDDVDFALVVDPQANRDFLTLDWVRGWLREAFIDGKRRSRGGRFDPDTDMQPGEYWAHFIVLLDAFTQACAPPRFQIVDIFGASSRPTPIEVDLAVDVGNSRTCGVLIEQGRQQDNVEITQADRLELRDLSRPERAYADPFESRVEFAPVAFGRRHWSRRAGRRTDGFWWPSPVRIGPEASWLASKEDGTEGVSGLSSPKRYLWDKAARPQAWINNRGALPPEGRRPAITGPIVAELAENGEIALDQSDLGVTPKYSRSSLFTLMLAELLLQAISQINAPARRQRRMDTDMPRRLRNVILTLPSATPVAEQEILRKRSRDAVKLVWRAMGWEKTDVLHPSPTIKSDWDEASCTHLVYLYNEISKKFRGNPLDFFNLMGRKREGAGQATMRIASLDIGGGTTDLMIIQHEIEDGNQRTVTPRQIFREGFRQAGDDILRAVLEQILLPQLKPRLAEVGVRTPDALVDDLFGGDREGMGQQDRAMRALIAQQILAPAGLGLLSAYEATHDPFNVVTEKRRLGEYRGGGPEPSAAVMRSMARRIDEAGGTQTDFLSFDIEMRTDKIEGVIRQVMGRLVEDLCDVVRACDCDVLLLSGRPSRFPAITDLVQSNLPVTPDRIVPMHGYRVGEWYPFRAVDFRIRDPKTTAVVGALLCNICEGIEPGLTMRASRIKMKSTARYIGVMENSLEIKKQNIVLSNVDLDARGQPMDFTIAMEGAAHIGFRQLPIERWTASPLYYLSFKSPKDVPKYELPVMVDITRGGAVTEAEEANLEDFKIADAQDRGKRPLRQDVELRLQTLAFQHSGSGYWLDTGILRTREQY